MKKYVPLLDLGLHTVKRDYGRSGWLNDFLVESKKNLHYVHKEITEDR